MPVTINGTTGIAGPDGSASTPAVQGTDSNTGFFFPAADTVAISTGGTQRLRLDSSGNLGLGVTPSAGSAGKVFQITNAGHFMASGPFVYIDANAYFDSGWKYITTAAASNYYQDSGAHIWQTAPSGTENTAIPFTQAMTLDASGNLVVGATSTSYRMEVVAPSGDNITALFRSGDATAANNAGGGFRSISSATAASRIAQLWLDADGANFSGLDYFYISKVGNSGDVQIWQQSNAAMTFATNGTERARITSGGYFKASNSGTYLGSTGTYHEIRQTNNSTGVVIAATNASFDTVNLQVDVTRNTTNNSFYAIGYYNRDAGAWRFYVADSGNVTNTNNSYGAISDVKTKQDIVDAASQWDDLKGLKVRKFRYKNDPTAPLQIGLVAQEAETVSPGLIDEHPDYEEVEVTDEEGNVKTERQLTGTSTKSIKYSVLYMKAIKALQEAMARIETLEAKVAALEGTQP